MHRRKTWSVTDLSCADPEIFMRGGPTKMVIFGHKRGGVQPPQKSRNYLFLGKIFKLQGGSGPPVPPSGSAHAYDKRMVKDISTAIKTIR